MQQTIYTTAERRRELTRLARIEGCSESEAIAKAVRLALAVRLGQLVVVGAEGRWAHETA